MRTRAETLELMLTMQHTFNLKVHPQYYEQNYPWDVAIVTELTEGLNYLHWEWWKNTNTPVNIAQLQLEIVDTWHFLMSKILCNGFNHGGYFRVDALADPLDLRVLVNEVLQDMSDLFLDNSTPNKQYTPVDMRNGIMDTILYMGDMGDTVHVFSFACVACGIHDIDELYKLYVGKNALNYIRQHNGYKQGTYIKMWAPGVEDNVFLHDLVENLPDDELTLDNLIVLLQQEYTGVLTK
jgi:hypothetical protein